MFLVLADDGREGALLLFGELCFLFLLDILGFEGLLFPKRVDRCHALGLGQRFEDMREAHGITLGGQEQGVGLACQPGRGDGGDFVGDGVRLGLG